MRKERQTLKEALIFASEKMKRENLPYASEGCWRIFEGLVEMCDPREYRDIAESLGLSFVSFYEFGFGAKACLSVCINRKEHSGAYPPIKIPGGNVDSNLMSYENLNTLKVLFLIDGCAELVGDVFSYTWVTSGSVKRLSCKIKRIPTLCEYRKIAQSNDAIDSALLLGIIEEL